MPLRLPGKKLLFATSIFLATELELSRDHALCRKKSFHIFNVNATQVMHLILIARKYHVSPQFLRHWENLVENTAVNLQLPSTWVMIPF